MDQLKWHEALKGIPASTISRMKSTDGPLCNLITDAEELVNTKKGSYILDSYNPSTFTFTWVDYRGKEKNRSFSITYPGDPT